MEVTNFAKEQINVRKTELRREALQRRKELDKKEKSKAAFLLTERILGHQWYYLSDNLLGFMPYGEEIDVKEILRDALKKGKNLFLPKVTEEGMQFFKISSLESLVEGYRGILEPRGDTEIYIYGEEIASKTLLLMPGVAFDSMRNRIGYGKGFYDRYLQDKDVLQLRSIAVGYQCQMVEAIPALDTDIKPYQVICF